jgi:hypothetical protein
MKQSGMFVALHRLVGRRRARQRERAILRECGCVAYCPGCRDPLNDRSEWWPNKDDGRGKYKCDKCGRVSEWHFGIAPGPILLTPNAPHEPAREKGLDT